MDILLYSFIPAANTPGRCKASQSGKNKEETVQAKRLINATLRSNQPATLILKGIELSDEVQLKSVIVNGREIQWKTSDVIAE
ncbi:unnamed protein product [Toxocara canis]|uniref:Transport energizing protein, ExbD/TolR family n=1 Tax=Toxocara canis TaxID=6265 RepID=A0A183U5H0_TOXCA|nr:unnamed protein product [Toxocara canis]